MESEFLSYQQAISQYNKSFGFTPWNLSNDAEETYSPQSTFPGHFPSSGPCFDFMVRSLSPNNASSSSSALLSPEGDSHDSPSTPVKPGDLGTNDRCPPVSFSVITPASTPCTLPISPPHESEDIDTISSYIHQPAAVVPTSVSFLDSPPSPESSSTVFGTCSASLLHITPSHTNSSVVLEAAVAAAAAATETLFQDYPTDYSSSSSTSSSSTMSSPYETGDGQGFSFQDRQRFLPRLSSVVDCSSADLPCGTTRMIKLEPQAGSALDLLPHSHLSWKAEPPLTEQIDSSSTAKLDEPYAQLIYKAFMSTPDHTMTLQQVYDWFRKYTTKAANEKSGWQNSIRHNLSMNAAFKKREKKEDTGSPITNASVGEAKRSTEWVLESWAVDKGVQSTTRYRKGTSARRSASRKTITQQPASERPRLHMLASTRPQSGGGRKPACGNAARLSTSSGGAGAGGAGGRGFDQSLLVTPPTAVQPPRHSPISSHSSILNRGPDAMGFGVFHPNVAEFSTSPQGGGAADSRLGNYMRAGRDHLRYVGDSNGPFSDSMLSGSPHSHQNSEMGYGFDDSQLYDSPNRHSPISGFGSHHNIFSNMTDSMCSSWSQTGGGRV